MEEKDKQVVEETTQDNVTKVNIKQTEEDDNVIKVNLDKPPTPKEEKNEEPKENKETETSSADDSGVAAESENAEPTQEQKFKLLNKAR